LFSRSIANTGREREREREAITRVQSKRQAFDLLRAGGQQQDYIRGTKAAGHSKYTQNKKYI
jgi:hypothetical protein